MKHNADFKTMLYKLDHFQPFELVFKRMYSTIGSVLTINIIRLLNHRKKKKNWENLKVLGNHLQQILLFSQLVVFSLYNKKLRKLKTLPQK